jgi:hypothetical protein
MIVGNLSSVVNSALVWQAQEILCYIFDIFLVSSFRFILITWSLNVPLNLHINIRFLNPFMTCLSSDYCLSFNLQGQS